MNNSISFTGSIRLRDYSKKIERTFKTTPEQDNLLMEAAKKLAPADTLRVFKNEQVQDFHKLLEKITNFKITNVNNEKGFHYARNNITFADRFIRPWAGIHVDINI
jgi:hypothetical protein